MQAQDTTTFFVLKVWPWIETNRNRLIGGAAVLVVAAFVVWFFIWEGQQKEIEAGQALTQVVVTPGGPAAAAYLKVASQYPNTSAGRRAQLDGATALFTAGQYSDAETQYRKFLEDHPDSEFSGEAALGIAVSLEAQNKPDLAASAYQRVLQGTSDPMSVSMAKFGLAGIDAAQGHLNEALMYYEDVAHGNSGTSIGAEAGLRSLEVRKLMPAPSSPAAPAAMPPASTGIPLKLSNKP